MFACRVLGPDAEVPIAFAVSLGLPSPTWAEQSVLTLTLGLVLGTIPTYTQNSISTTCLSEFHQV